MGTKTVLIGRHGLCHGNRELAKRAEVFGVFPGSCHRSRRGNERRNNEKNG
jgi:hypothetical protein